jgi:hypothetical protein
VVTRGAGNITVAAQLRIEKQGLAQFDECLRMSRANIKLLQLRIVDHSPQSRTLIHFTLRSASSDTKCDQHQQRSNAGYIQHTDAVGRDSDVQLLLVVTSGRVVPGGQTLLDRPLLQPPLYYQDSRIAEVSL